MPARVKKNSKAEKNQNGSFRIIGGSHRSRRLSFPAVEGLRPTTDRVRETLFNWLQNDIPGARILDLFAGSGALGFESASRGASEVTFVELNSLAQRALQENASVLNVAVNLVRTDALAFLDAPLPAPFDIVFIDPPFRKDLVQQVVDGLTSRGFLKPGSLIYLETEAELCLLAIPESWTELKSKKAGQVSYRLFETN